MAIEANTTAASVCSQLEMPECPIAKLADEDLAAIFKHLPHYERLIVSEVCIKWRYLSKTPWLGVTDLDLRQVPTENIHAVIKKCPSLTFVSAQRQNLGDLRCFASRLSRITSLSCVDCTFTADKDANQILLLRESIRSASWQELIWHNCKTVLMDSGMSVRESSLPCGSPSTLRRLQMSGLSGALEALNLYEDARQALWQLPLLESCILADVGTFTNEAFARFCLSQAACHSLHVATNLRELYLDLVDAECCLRLVPKLPELKILYLNNIDFRWGMVQCLTQHPSLRVLVLTASCASDYYHGDVVVPARKLFPNGFNAPPVPQLHLFLGKIAAEKLRFRPSPSDALKIYPIDAPLPEFLERDEIKPIFEGSWIAS